MTNKVKPLTPAQLKEQQQSNLYAWQRGVEEGKAQVIDAIVQALGIQEMIDKSLAELKDKLIDEIDERIERNNKDQDGYL